MVSPPPLIAFTGQQSGSHGKGIVELILFKWDIARYILHDWSQTVAFSADALTEIKKTFASIGNYRKQCGFPSARCDMTFRAGWLPSCEELFVLVESILFDVMYDAHLKDALKSSASPSDAVATQLNGFLQQIAARAEKDKAITSCAQMHDSLVPTLLLLLRVSMSLYCCSFILLSAC